MINSITLDGRVHDAMSPREIMTGKVQRIPPCKLGEYVQAKVPTTNNTDKERIVNTLYNGSNDKCTGYYVFKLKTKEKILVPKVTPISMTESIIKVINKIGEEEGEVEGIQFENMFGEVRINNIKVCDIKQGSLNDDDQNNEDSIVTDD